MEEFCIIHKKKRIEESLKLESEERSGVGRSSGYLTNLIRAFSIYLLVGLTRTQTFLSQLIIGGIDCLGNFPRRVDREGTERSAELEIKYTKFYKLMLHHSHSQPQISKDCCVLRIAQNDGYLPFRNNFNRSQVELLGRPLILTANKTEPDCG